LVLRYEKRKFRSNKANVDVADDLFAWSNIHRCIFQPDAGRANQLTTQTIPKIQVYGKELEEYESVKAWKNSMQPASANSWRRQKSDLYGYCVWRQKDPDAILAERRANRAKDPEARLEEIGSLKYRQALWDRGLAPGSGQKALISIVSFFKHNYQALVFATFPNLSADQYKGAKRLTKEEVVRLYTFAGDYRDKLIVVGGAESGLRLQGLQALTLGSIVAIEDGSREGTPCQKIEDLDNVTIPTRINLPTRFYTARRKREGITFVCKDFIKLLKEYLQLRRKLGEPISARSPIFPTFRVRLRVLPNGPIILRHRDSWASTGTKVMATATLGGGGTTAGPTPNHGQVECEVIDIACNALADDSIEAVFRRVRDKTGITFDPESERAVSPHSLRKYLHSTLDASGVNSVMVNVIIGHSNAIADHYSGRRYLDLEEIRHAYESAMHRIAVTEESNGTRVLKLESDLKAQRSVYEQDREHYANLERGLAQVTQMMIDNLTKGADPLKPEDIARLSELQKLLQDQRTT